MMKNYYLILKIPHTANNKEIKKAYRQAALFWHPDKNKAPNAQEKFIDIVEAYNILIDPIKRNLYDKLLSNSQFLDVNPAISEETKEDFKVYWQWIAAERIKAQKLALTTIDDVLTETFHFLDNNGKIILIIIMIATILLILIFGHK